MTKRNLCKYFFLLLCGISIYSLSFSQTEKSVKEIVNTKEKNNLYKYLDEKKWNELFPNRYNLSAKKKGKKTDFYTFRAFIKAAEKFPLFIAEGDEETQKRELCAFLANVAQETSGGWDGAHGGYFKWGLVYIEELGCEHGCMQYSDTNNKEFYPIQNVSYHGRGPKQLSWNYNYGQFSKAYYGSKDTLLMHPELLSEEPILSFASAIWFWMTPQQPKPSCHDIMCGKWIASAVDIQDGRLPGFGATVNVINGGIECGKTASEKTKYRYEYYKYFCRYFKVSAGDNIECSNQKPFNVQ